MPHPPRSLRWLLAATLAVLSGCESVGPVEIPPRLTPVISSVTVSPDDITVTVGATLSLEVIALDQFGQQFPGPAPVWQTLNANLATVNDGVVSTLAEGTARIVATANGRADTATVRVSGAPPERTSTSITIARASVVTLARGSTGLVRELPSVFIAGDESANAVTLEGLAMYSLANIPAGAEIERASLSVMMDPEGVFGNPFSLGSLYVERAVDKLMSEGDPDGESKLVAAAFTPLTSTNVVDLLRAAQLAGDEQVIFRFRFTRASNLNGVSDYLEPVATTLAMTYTR